MFEISVLLAFSLLVSACLADPIQQKSAVKGWNEAFPYTKKRQVPPGPVIPSFKSNETGSSNGTWPWQIFKTEPFNPPVFEINATGEPLSPGYLFISPSNFEPQVQPSAVKQASPVIMTDQGMS